MLQLSRVLGAGCVVLGWTAVEGKLAEGREDKRQGAKGKGLGAGSKTSYQVSGGREDKSREQGAGGKGK